MAEYCQDYGIAFDNKNLENKLDEMITNYSKYVEKLKSYKFDADLMCTEFENLFVKMNTNKYEYYENRFIDTKPNILYKKLYNFRRNIRHSILNLN